MSYDKVTFVMQYAKKRNTFPWQGNSFQSDEKHQKNLL